MDKKAYLITLCKLYKGKHVKQEYFSDEFKHYIWKREKNIVERCEDESVKKEYHISDKESLEVYFKTEIQAAIDLYADAPFGGNPTPFYERYFKL